MKLDRRQLDELVLIMQRAVHSHRHWWSIYARDSNADLAALEKRLHKSAQELLDLAQADVVQRDAIATPAAAPSKKPRAPEARPNATEQ